MNKDTHPGFYNALYNLRDMGLIVIDQDENGEMIIGVVRDAEEVTE